MLIDYKFVYMFSHLECYIFGSLANLFWNSFYTVDGTTCYFFSIVILTVCVEY